jgi:hypothetical protein
LNFEKDYPDLFVVKLEQNYRSTKTIVEAANSIIDKNKAQLKKVVWTSNPEGDLIELIKADWWLPPFSRRKTIRNFRIVTLPSSTAPTPSPARWKKHFEN